MLPAPEAAGPAYAGIRTRVTGLLVGAGPEVAGLVVPACPDWTVKDLTAHLVGACEDILAGRLEGVATDAWTDAQVARHHDTSLAELLDTWGEAGPAVEAITGAFPASAAAQWVFDATTHEQDLRGALGAPGGREDDNVAIAVAFLLHTLDGLVREHGLPTLAVAVDGAAPSVLGSGEPVVRLDVSGYDLVRALGGRRSLDQVRALGWDGDPEPYFVLFGGILKPPAHDVVE